MKCGCVRTCHFGLLTLSRIFSGESVGAVPNWLQESAWNLTQPGASASSAYAAWLPAIDPALKTDTNSVPGCVTQVWVHAAQEAEAPPSLEVRGKFVGVPLDTRRHQMGTDWYMIWSRFPRCRLRRFGNRISEWEW